ncbi:MAG: hypothetical protein ACI4MN_04440 [Candidatus Coproplasma sp.]
MKKDLFNGNIKREFIGYMELSIFLIFFICFVGSAVFLLIALFYENIDHVGRIVLYVMSGITFLCAVLFPVLSVYVIRNHTKHPKLTKIMFKPFVFKDN